MLLRENIETVGSGRTDTHVHALQQIAHFDTYGKIDPVKIKNRLNNYLSRDIAVKQIWEVESDDHARFDAIQRCYEYKITTVKNPFLIYKAYDYRKKVDLGKMNRAAKIIQTTRDFQSFSRVKTEVNHFLCHVSYAHWEKVDELIIFSVCADRFLRGMVRSLVGTMLDIGTELISLSEFKEIIREKDRRAAGRAVPANGLYLKSVRYPEHIYKKITP
jgi:tRNA pseudouridine38-40 synthase